MTAPERPASGLDANARGIIVLVVAVVVGLGLLFNAGAGADDSASPSSTTIPGPTVDVDGTTTTPTTGGTGTTGTTATGDSTTTTGDAGDGEARSAGDVTVVVLNGSGKNGAASANTETIESAGYKMGKAGDAASPNSGTTVVYYAEGYEADATAVAAVLGKAASAVEAKPEDNLGAGSAEANVVVVLGATDTAPVT